MGNLCSFHLPIPPPQLQLVGEWILNQESQNFKIGSYIPQHYRYKIGTNLLGLGVFKQNINKFCDNYDGEVVIGMQNQQNNQNNNQNNQKNQKNEQFLCHLTIQPTGIIQYYQYSKSHWIIIQGPVYSWQNSSIKSIKGSCLNYDYSKINNHVLMINGMELIKRDSKLQEAFIGAETNKMLLESVETADFGEM